MANSPLSLSVYFGCHDSAVTVADTRRVLLHLEAERVVRRKHCRLRTVEEMEQLVATALAYVGSDIGSVDRLYVGRYGNQYQTADLTLLGRAFRGTLVSHHHAHIGTVLDHGGDTAVVVVADGGSEDGTTKIYFQDESGRFSLLEDLDGTAATGKFYAGLTMLTVDPVFTSAHAWNAGKTMGLAAYGEYRPELIPLLREPLPGMNREEDVERTAADTRRRFGLSDDYARPWEDPARRDLARTGQDYFRDYFLDRLRPHAGRSDIIALAGGCALNVLLNSAILESGLFRRVHLGPVPSDSGQSLGALLLHERAMRDDPPFLGRGFGELNELPSRVADDLLAGRVVGWFQGRSEIGPRALGHRSLLGLPNTPAQRDRMNRIKGREPYRPVAPIVLLDALPDFFETDTPSPFMSFAPRVREVTARLAPAVVHADGTARLQTVGDADNPVLARLLRVLGDQTGAPILMNTSFNVGPEPIVDTPDDALRTFRASEIDVLYLNGERHER